MVIAAPQHEERVSNDSFNFVRIQIKVIPYNLLLSSLDSVGRLFWKTIVLKYVSYPPAPPVCVEVSFYDFPLFNLSIMSISAPVPVVVFQKFTCFAPLVCVTEFCSDCGPLMFDDCGIEVGTVFVSCCIITCGCVCVCVCLFLLLALGKLNFMK